MYTTVIAIAIALIVVQYQLASLKQKISDLKTENEALKNSIKDEKNKLSFIYLILSNPLKLLRIILTELKKRRYSDIKDKEQGIQPGNI